MNGCNKRPQKTADGPRRLLARAPGWPGCCGARASATGSVRRPRLLDAARRFAGRRPDFKGASLTGCYLKWWTGEHRRPPGRIDPAPFLVFADWCEDNGFPRPTLTAVTDRDLNAGRRSGRPYPPASASSIQRDFTETAG
jgi:hypothetical protein